MKSTPSTRAKAPIATVARPAAPVPDVASLRTSAQGKRKAISTAKIT